MGSETANEQICKGANKMKESLESRVAKLEQKVNELLCENANNAATIDFVAMMADVEIPEDEDQEGEGDE